MPAIASRYLPMRCEDVRQGWAGEQSTNVPDQHNASPCLLGVSIGRGGSDVLLESLQLGFETFYLLLDVFEFLRPPISAMHDGHPPDPYLAMLDERSHAAEGTLEGREGIGGLFRDIEEYLHAVCNPLPLCWEPPRGQRVDSTEGVESAHLGLDPSCSQRPQNPLDAAFETWVCFLGVFVDVIGERWAIEALARKPRDQA